MNNEPGPPPPDSARPPAPVDTAPLPDCLALQFCGLRFASPLVLLSGCAGFGDEYTRVAGFSNRDTGAVVLAGTTAAARLGHAPHRLCETPSGLLNAVGWQNPGVVTVVEQLLPALDFSETRFIANVCGGSIREYEAVTRRFDQSSIDAIEINLACPNDEDSGIAFGQRPDTAARLVAACRRLTRKPLITKLSADQADIRESARLCIEAGSDALAVINLVDGMTVDIHRRRPVLAHGHGGLSGPAIKPIALLKVRQVYEVAHPLGIPIIGQGGIASAQDALEFILAGATAIGIGTALFYDPLLCKSVNTGIAQYLQLRQLASVNALTGALQSGAATADL